MLTHPGMERLQAFSAGELSGESRRRTAAHLARCTRCRATVSWIADVRAVVRDEVPPPAPQVWQRIATRVEAGESVLLPAEGTGRPVTVARGGRALRVAGLALLLAGAGAAAMPDSWLRRAIEGALPHTQAAPAAAPDEPPVTAAQPPVILYVEPSAGSVLIALRHPDPSVRVHIRLVDDTEVEVRAAGGATFRSAPGRLDIVGAESGSILLALPRTLGRVRVEVDGRTLAVKERGEVRILAPVADTMGAEYILPVRGIITPAAQ